MQLREYVTDTRQHRAPKVSQEELSRLRSDLNKRGGAGTRAVGLVLEQRDGFLCSIQRSNGLRGCLDTLGLGDSPKE